jgi:glycosyltransferase involved in cell wall biosynthesis
VNKVNFTSVVSPKMKKVMTEHHYCSYNIAYIPNAVDDSFFINGKSSYQNVGNFKWVTVGRLARIKGYDHLIEACYLLKKSSIPFTLDIYGTGPEYEILRNKISHLGLAKVIKLKGINQNISSIISNYDGFISSSVLEAFGIVIIEALAAGLPVLTTDCEGPIQILGRTSEFGIVCNKESPYDLSDKMKIMMNMSIKDRVAIAISGRELVKRDYSLANISSQWLNIYNAY